MPGMVFTAFEYSATRAGGLIELAPQAQPATYCAVASDADTSY